MDELSDIQSILQPLELILEFVEKFEGKKTATWQALHKYHSFMRDQLYSWVKEKSRCAARYSSLQKRIVDICEEEISKIFSEHFNGT